MFTVITIASFHVFFAYLSIHLPRMFLCISACSSVAAFTYTLPSLGAAAGFPPGRILHPFLVAIKVSCVTHLQTCRPWRESIPSPRSAALLGRSAGWLSRQSPESRDASPHRRPPRYLIGGVRLSAAAAAVFFGLWGGSASLHHPPPLYHHHHPAVMSPSPAALSQSTFCADLLKGIWHFQSHRRPTPGHRRRQSANRPRQAERCGGRNGFRRQQK